MSHYSAENVELIDINQLRTEKETIKFAKMQSTGNDFIVINTDEQEINNPGGLAVRLCNRRSGIGADSIVLFGKSDKADAKVRFFNLDGSEGMMAGNALRAVSKYIYDNNVYGIADKNESKSEPTATMKIETKSGVKTLTLYKLDGKVSSVTVDMGKPEFAAEKLPTTLEEVALNMEGLPEKAIVNQPLTVDGINYGATCVSVGNPHCVVFCGFVDKVDVKKIGPMFENNEEFPDRTNTEFVRVVGPNELKMRTWERGNGETPACGTGACAAVIAAVLNGYCKLNENVTVNVRGGKLIVKYTGDTVYLTGTTEFLYDGKVVI